MLFRPFCKTGHHLICNLITLRHKSCTWGSKNVQEMLFRGVWSLVAFQLTIHKGTKYFGKAICCLRGKSLNNTTSIKDLQGTSSGNEKEILSRWREYLEDLLNAVRATPTCTCAMIDFGKEEVFTLTGVVAAI